MTEPGLRAGRGNFDVLYRTHWWPLVRLAAGLLGQRGAAEDVVQDAFAAFFSRSGDLRDAEAAIGYLRRSVVNGTRSVLRHRVVAQRHLSTQLTPDGEPADAHVVRTSEQEAVRVALRGLPDRQREVLTLYFVGELTDAEIADATGISAGSVRSSRSRGLAALRETLEAGE